MENKYDTTKFGLKFDDPNPEHWVFGASPIPFEQLQPNGDWAEYLPIKELQNLNGIETYACVVFTLLNCLEILIKRKYGVERNYSERFLATIADTYKKKGSSPQEVCEFLRKLGVPPQDVYPFDTSVTTTDIFFKQLSPELYDIAKKFNEEWDFKHEFVVPNNNNITQALKCSPLMISVYAWVKNNKGLYYRPQGEIDVHATTLFYERQGEFRRVFDTYDSPHIKDYDYSSMPMLVKRFWIERKKPASPNEVQVKKNPVPYFTRDLNYGMFGKDVYLLQECLEYLGYGDFVPTGFFGSKTMQAVANFQKANNITPSVGYFGGKTRPVFINKVRTMNRNKIWISAISFIGKDASPNDIAPDEFGCAESTTVILQRAGVDIKTHISTYQLYQDLRNRNDFIAVDQPLPGDIIISPTGFGNGKLPNGHTGIVDENNNILSNSSKTGTFERNYTLESWKERYSKIGGYPVLFFRVV